MDQLTPPSPFPSYGATLSLEGRDETRQCAYLAARAYGLHALEEGGRFNVVETCHWVALSISLALHVPLDDIRAAVASGLEEVINQNYAAATIAGEAHAA